MANLETLTKRLEKERALEKKHKQNADKLQKEIESQMSQEIGKSVNKLNLSADEYQRVMKAFHDKDSLMDAVNLVVGEKGTGFNVMEDAGNDKDTAAEDQ